jgi:hypothetical protein
MRNQIRSGGAGLQREESSDGAFSGQVVIKDKVPESAGFVFIVSGIGDIEGESVELDLTGKKLTSYRFKPSVDMRVAEDATDVTEAETWLQADPTTWVALANGQLFCRPPIDVSETEWSEWRDFPEGDYITNLWFLRDVAGAADATALVECE